MSLNAPFRKSIKRLALTSSCRIRAIPDSIQSTDTTTERFRRYALTVREGLSNSIPVRVLR